MNIEQIIELVEKWIADPKSVSYEELKFARDAARAAAYAAACPLLNADVYAAAISAHAALNGDIDAAKLWVAEYHKNKFYKYWV